MFTVAVWWITAFSVITFSAYGIDKIKARLSKWRIKECVLLILSALGGAVGGVIAMLLFRHKTCKKYFWLVNVASLILHTAILIFIYINY